MGFKAWVINFSRSETVLEVLSPLPEGCLGRLREANSWDAFLSTSFVTQKRTVQLIQPGEKIDHTAQCFFIGTSVDIIPFSLIIWIHEHLKSLEQAIILISSL